MSHPAEVTCTSGQSRAAFSSSDGIEEEFDDNHSDIDYRMDVSLPFLYETLKP